MKPQASGACQRITRVSRGEPGSLVDPCLGRVGLVACGVGSDEWRPPPKGVLIFKAGRGRRPPLPSRLGPGRGGYYYFPPQWGRGGVVTTTTTFPSSKGGPRLLLFPRGMGSFFRSFFKALVAQDPSFRTLWNRILL